MPIIQYKPDSDLPIQPNLPTIQPANYKSIVNDDKEFPIRSLLAYIEGAPWYVDYYQQILSKHNELKEIDPAQPNIYQQYQKITGLELRVNSPLDTSYDSTTGITSSSGTATIYPFIVPNINDYFITDTGDSLIGIFRITNVERKNFNRDSAFSINYTMVGYSNQSPELYNALIDKTTKTYYFSKDRLVDGSQPLLQEKTYIEIKNLKVYYSDIVKYYFKTFFNKQYMTLVIPGQSVGIYDCFLVNYILKIVDSFDAPEIRNTRQITVDKEYYLQQSQFWELMLNRDYGGLRDCNKIMTLMPKNKFNNNAYLHGFGLSYLDYIVYPDITDTSAIVNDTPEPKQSYSSLSIDGKLLAISDVCGVLDQTTITQSAINNIINGNLSVIDKLNALQLLINTTSIKVIIPSKLSSLTAIFSLQINDNDKLANISSLLSTLETDNRLLAISSILSILEATLSEVPVIKLRAIDSINFILKSSDLSTDSDRKLLDIKNILLTIDNNSSVSSKLIGIKAIIETLVPSTITIDSQLIDITNTANSNTTDVNKLTTMLTTINDIPKTLSTNTKLIAINGILNILGATTSSSPSNINDNSFQTILEANTTDNKLLNLTYYTYTDGSNTYPLIKTVTEDKCYVLSTEFYTNESGLSLLEILTKDYLKLQTIDLDKLTELCARYRDWGKLEQFYYGPILLTLIKETDRSRY